MLMDIIFLIIIVFVVQYFVMSWITTNNYSDITNSLNKMYLSGILALLVSLGYVLLKDLKEEIVSCNYWIGLGIGVGFITYAYRNQLGITEYDWANWMIEQQSAGIFASEPIIKANQKNQTNQTNQTNLSTQSKHLAAYIVKNQTEEINIFKQLSSLTKQKSLIY